MAVAFRVPLALSLFLLLLKDTSASNSTLPSSMGCEVVEKLPTFCLDICHLNATLTCSENKESVIHAPECLVVATIIGVVIIVAIVALVGAICCILYYIRKKQCCSSCFHCKNYSPLSQEEDQQEAATINSTELSERRASNSSNIGYLNKKTQEMNQYGVDQADSDSPKIEQKAEESGPLSRPRTLSQVKRDDTRIKESEREKEEVKAWARKGYKELPDLGSRLQKHWFKGKISRGKQSIIIKVKASRQCPVDFNDPNELRTLNDLIHKIEHPYLQIIYKITPENENIEIVQDFFKLGSVRDYLHQSNPLKDWEKKYLPTGGIRLFSKSEIMKCGFQILQAAEILYDLGFTYIGQIHSGNVFISKTEDYILGGYENSLLGFRASVYAIVSEEGLLDNIDIIMFGHLIYEMCTGKSLPNKLEPKHEDLITIKDPELQEIIQFIFDTAKENENQRHLMLKISYHRFFTSSPISHKKLQVKPIKLTDQMMKLISTVFPGELTMEIICANLGEKYTNGISLPKLGWRSEKLWFKSWNTQLDTEGLLTVVEVPQQCPVFLEGNMNDLRNILIHKLQQKLVFHIRDIDHIKIDKRHYIVIFQDRVDIGSLRDKIYGISPYTPYASKYKTKGSSMSAGEVIKFGAQILQAMHYLAHLDGSEDPLVLGCVHTGNMFIEGDVCKLGGFENAIFRYPTQKHYGCHPTDLSTLDIVMFGHAVFEMSTGRKLNTEKPTEGDYEHIPKDLQLSLRYIFENGNPALVEVMKFFHVSPIPSSNDSQLLSNKQKRLVKKVRKRKPRDQNDFIAIRKFNMQSKMGSFFTQ